MSNIIAHDPDKVPKSVPYYGGKNATSHHNKVGRWLARNLPIREVYVEPFAGMAGVLLQRRRSLNEVLNDKDARIINWWRCVRDEPDEFARLLLHSPRSGHEFERAKRYLMSRTLADPSDPDGKPDLEMGLAAHIVLTDSLMHGLGESARKMYMAECWSRRYSRAVPEVHALAVRMRKVQLSSKDAVEILWKTAKWGNSVIYCDPPYAQADTSCYGESVGDRDALAEALQAQKGLVALSGYGDEWDSLGWWSKDFPAIFTGSGQSAGGIGSRVERVWINRPHEERSLFDVDTGGSAR